MSLFCVMLLDLLQIIQFEMVCDVVVVCIYFTFVYVDDVCSKLYFFVKRSRCRRHDARVKSTAEMCPAIAAAVTVMVHVSYLEGMPFTCTAHVLIQNCLRFVLRELSSIKYPIQIDIRAKCTLIIIQPVHHLTFKCITNKYMCIVCYCRMYRCIEYVIIAHWIAVCACSSIAFAKFLYGLICIV